MAIALCVLMVLAGLVMVVRWGAHPREIPAAPRGMLRYAAVALAAGVVAGMLAAGAGGRLVMRLLAATSPDAEGSITEADQIVGDITLGGTLGLILFAGVLAGLLSAAIYALAGPALPRGRAGGVALGVLLLVIAGTRVDPLRPDNFDFALVGPAWLAIGAFAALALFQGMLVVALGGRMSRAPALALPALVPRWLTASRIAVVALLLVALPGFVIGVTDIVDRGP